MAKNDSRTRAFDTTANHKTKYKSKKRIRQQLVIAIFVVIALILVVFATLIIGKIITIKNTDEPDTPPIYTVTKQASDVHKGNLLLINNSYKFDYSINGLISNSYDNLPSGIVNLWTFKHNSTNDAETKITIPGTGIQAPTYELGGGQPKDIALEEITLHAFNQMMLDYCKTLDLSSYSSGSASKINVAWGWSYEGDLLNNDLTHEDRGATFWSQADGKSLTLMHAGTQAKMSETILKNQFSWIYQNAHKYGFINRYPNACEEHTGLNSNTRIHLRYIGAEHATYIHNEGCCLDEYLRLLREQHGYDNPLVFTANNKTYNVYYVECTGNPASIPVPEDSNYYISGDNRNGFIVTVEK